jgi:HSP20 family protein
MKNTLIPSGKFFNQIFDDLFNRGLTELVGNDILVSQPSINVKEFDTHFTVEVAAPGMEKKDFNIQFQNEMLTIEGKNEKASEDLQDNGKYVRREFHFTTFRRSFHVPSEVKSDDIKATYDNGILMITLPKLNDVKKENGRTITIN